VFAALTIFNILENGCEDGGSGFHCVVLVTAICRTRSWLEISLFSLTFYRSNSIDLMAHTGRTIGRFEVCQRVTYLHTWIERIFSIRRLYQLSSSK
jgi:hypothetical protein